MSTRRDGVEVRPPTRGTRLILDPAERLRPTGHRETDARTALTRGLAEYLESLVLDMPGGRQVRMRRVYSTWAEWEDAAEYPAATVLAEGTGTYEPTALGQIVSSDVRLPPPDDTAYLMTGAELDQTLRVEVWTTDPKERVAIAAMIEDGLTPVDWMYGVRLEFPHYYNERGTYSLLSVAYEDSDVDATRRYRKVVFSVAARVPVIRVMRFPLARPRAPVETTEL